MKMNNKYRVFTHRTTLTNLAFAVVIGFTSLSAQAGSDKMVPKDGEITVPADYRGWNKFVPTVEKEKAGQVREIYINEIGLKTQKGEAFPAGSLSVMEIYSAEKDANGKLLRNTEGSLVKGQLAKIFVMAKGSHWGSKLSEQTVKNGDWVYSAYQSDGQTPATSDYTKCRSCHKPLADTDFVARYDEHFSAR